MNYSGYNNYSLDGAISSLINGNLIIVTGEGDSGGHAWILDGYKHVKETHLTYDENGNIVPCDILNPYCWVDEYKYLHFNLGWNGYCSGMYLESGKHNELYDHTCSYPSSTYVYENIFSSYPEKSEEGYSLARPEGTYSKIQLLDVSPRRLLNK